MLGIKIINGKVLDLKKDELKDVDVGIKDGKIAAVGKDLADAYEVIDAKGQIVSPGFIDIHMHEERREDAEGVAYDISECMLRMGVTTAVTGNCGSNRQDIRETERFVARNGNPVNYMAFTGHNYLRELFGNRDTHAESTPQQIERMARRIKDDIDWGAVGVSYGIEYARGMTLEEEVGVCRYIRGRDDLLLAAHYRYDADGALDSIREMAEISRQTGIAFQISHLSSCSAFGNMAEALDLIAELRREGLDLSSDAYPYSAFSTAIGSDVFEPGCLERWNVDYSAVELCEPPYEHVRCTEEIFEDARRNYPKMYAVAHVMNEDDIRVAMARPEVMVASDGLYRNHRGHPRGAGTFPRFLGKYVREEKLCDFYTAMKKIISLPAERLRIDSFKGAIEPGYDADITVFDKDVIIDRATFDSPQTPPSGISWVIVGGKVALRGQDIADRSCGRFIKRPGS